MVFTGTLLVVPDVVGGSRTGENTTTGRSATSRGSNDGFNSGVTVSAWWYFDCDEWLFDDDWCISKLNRD